MAGVKKSTVSNVINNKVVVKEETSLKLHQSPSLKYGRKKRKRKQRTNFYQFTKSEIQQLYLKMKLLKTTTVIADRSRV